METKKLVKVEGTPPSVLEAAFGTYGFPLFRRLTNELDFLSDRLGLDRFGFGRLGLGPIEAAWTPDVEMFKRDNNLMIRADIPGLKKEDVTIEVTDDAIVLRGERKEEKEEKKEGYYRAERRYGSFYRSLPLPEGVKIDDAKALMHDGTLEITMPVAKVEEKKRRVAIADAPVGEKATKHAA